MAGRRRAAKVRQLMSQIVRLSDVRRGRRGRVAFSRIELSQLLTVYSRRVARGEWRDYAIDHGVGMAAFSIFRRSHERPVYVVAKLVGPRGAQFVVFDHQNAIAKRAESLAEVLSHFHVTLSIVPS